MKDFELVAYTKDNGSVPVMNFVDEQRPKMKAKILRELDLLEEFGNALEGETTKHLGDGIFELRVKFSSDITRILYFFYVGKKIILTNGFVKKTQKTPSREIELAKKYRKDFIEKEGI